jgi:hypothetical protein
MRCLELSLEKKELELRLQKELIPSLADARNGWEDNLPEDEDPESYIQRLRVEEKNFYLLSNGNFLLIQISSTQFAKSNSHFAVG